MLVKPLLREQSPEYIAREAVMEDLSHYEQNLGNGIKTTRLLKRIPLKRLMDLKVDYAFKQLFGNEKNKVITMVFLNAVLKRTGQDRIKDISYTNIEAGGEYADDKQSRLDLLVITENEEWINVEIQFTHQYDMIKRSIYYWSGTYRNPMQKGMSYKELQPVIAINIMNFKLFNQTERFHTSFHLYEDEEKIKLTDIMGLHFIEMPKLIKDWKEEKLDPWNDVLARWLLLLGIVDHQNNKVYEDIYKELEDIAMKDKTLRHALENWEDISMTQEQYLAYESRLKRIYDEASIHREAELRLQEATEKAIKEGMEKGMKEGIEKGIEKGMKEGIDKGIEKGIKKGIEQGIEQGRRESRRETETIAYRLLAKGMTTKEVAEIANLREERVIEIQHGLKKG